MLYLHSCRTSATTIYINFLSSALRDANTSFRFDFTVWHVLYQFMSMMFFFSLSLSHSLPISSDDSNEFLLEIFFFPSRVGCSFILLRFGYIILFSLWIGYTTVQNNDITTTVRPTALESSEMNWTKARVNQVKWRRHGWKEKSFLRLT